MVVKYRITAPIAIGAAATPEICAAIGNPKSSSRRLNGVPATTVASSAVILREPSSTSREPEPVVMMPGSPAVLAVKQIASEGAAGTECAEAVVMPSASRRSAAAP